MKESDLLKKSEIIEPIFGFVPHVTLGMVTFSLDLTKSSWFINILCASIRFRLFENGGQLHCDICSYFGYEMSSEFHSLMSWNEVPLTQPLACSSGIYIQSLGKALNQSARGIIYHPGLVSSILKDKRFPSKNYLSWALHGTSSNKLLLKFVEKYEISDLLCK